jgi:hypothetical protein
MYFRTKLPFFVDYTARAKCRYQSRHSSSKKGTFDEKRYISSLRSFGHPEIAGAFRYLGRADFEELVHSGGYAD